MRFIKGLLLGLALILLSSSCSTYYTHLYLKEAPTKTNLSMDDTYVGVDNCIEGWNLSISIAGAYEDPNIKYFQSDSFLTEICAFRSDTNDNPSDSIYITLASISIGCDTTNINLKQYSWYSKKGYTCTEFNRIHIPVSKPSIELSFKVQIITQIGVESEKSCHIILHRYEIRNKGLLKGLLD